MPFYDVEPHAFDKEAVLNKTDVDVKIYVDKNLPLGDLVGLQCIYNDARNADMDDKYRRPTTSVTRLSRLVRRFMYGRPLINDALRAKLGPEVSIFRVNQAKSGNVSVVIEALDIYPREPRRHISGAVVRKEANGISTQLNIDHEQWLWLRSVVNSAEDNAERAKLHSVITDCLADNDCQADEKILAVIQGLYNSQTV